MITKIDELKLEKFKDADGREYGRIIINGRELIDLVSEIELPSIDGKGYPGQPGSYKYLPADVIFEPSFHLFNTKSPKYGYDKIKYYNSKWENKFPLLESPDNDGSDWALFVRISLSDSYITWERFEKVYKGQTEADPLLQFRGLGPFDFERKNYWDEKVKYFKNVENENLVYLLYYHKEEEIRTALRAIKQLRYYDDSGEDSLFCSPDAVTGTSPYFSHLQKFDIDKCELSDVLGRFIHKDDDIDDPENEFSDNEPFEYIFLFKIGFTLSRYYLTVNVTSGMPGFLAGGSTTFNFELKKNGEFLFTGKEEDMLF